MILYNAFIFLYYFGIRIAALWNRKAQLWIQGRKHVFEQLQEFKGESNNKVAWFHCASLGEFEQGKPIIEAFRDQFPDYLILVTFFSPSGYEVRRNWEGADCIAYLPMDMPRKAKRFVKIVEPSIAVFIKYELWANYLKALTRKDIPAVLASAVFHQNHRYFKWYGGFFRNLLKHLKHIGVQNQSSAEMLQFIGLSNYAITGDTRYDRVIQTKNDTEGLEIVEKFKGADPLIIGGSTWPPEENILARYINENHNGYKYIIAPHDISAAHLDSIENQIELPVVRHSQWDESKADHKVLLIDNIGLLASIYQYGTIAFIGGGFSGKLHNILEPAVFGNAVLFGPKHDRFPEANELIGADGAREIQDLPDFANFVNSGESTKIGPCAAQFCLKNTGATQKTMEILTNYTIQ